MRSFTYTLKRISSSELIEIWKSLDVVIRTIKGFGTKLYFYNAPEVGLLK